MKILGIVLAGGQSRRFGSDKALALLDGRPLIDHALAALAGCDAIAVAGRDWPGTLSLPDRPGPGLGPLGGLAAALHHAAGNGFSHVASLPVDCPGLRPGWWTQLAPAPAHARGQPLAGLWPVELARGLGDDLSGGVRRVQDWTASVGAAAVDLGDLANMNWPADLAAVAAIRQTD